MRLLAAGFTALACGFAAAGGALGATWQADKAANTRHLTVIRQYEIPVSEGRKTVAGVPALMSFWGATNEQAVVRSQFSYSVQPDEIRITTDDLGMRRRNYELTWNAPKVGRIRVKQELTVRLACRTALPTAATLPYPKEVLNYFQDSLAGNKEVDTDHPKIAEISKGITARTRSAEQAVELACDWVNENIRFKRGSPTPAAAVLGSRVGNCTGMANVACAILRKIGIPAETVSGTFVNGGGHGFMEAYFPDAGWAFYDLSNSTRGFKSLDCLMAAGWAFRVTNSEGTVWHKGAFCSGKDVQPFRETAPSRRVLRKGPEGKDVVGVRVIPRAPHTGAKLRHLPIRRLLADLSIPPGKREYVKKGPVVATATAPGTPDDEADTKAAATLKLAAAYAESGMKVKAAAIYRSILADYPNTKAAEHARKQLERLRK